MWNYIKKKLHLSSTVKPTLKQHVYFKPGVKFVINNTRVFPF